MRRWFALVGLVIGAIIASKLLIENVLGINLESAVSSWMAQAGAGSALTVVTLLAIDIFLPVPSSLVMVLSGAVFGVAWGSVLSLVGSVGGEWLGFELVRRYGRRISGRMVGDDEMRSLERLFARHGAAAVAMSRALPVVMETMSVVAGLSRMSRWTFLLASIAGTLPIVVIYAYAGAVSRQTGSLVPAVVILIAMAGGGWIWYRARAGAEPPAAPEITRTGGRE